MILLRLCNIYYVGWAYFPDDKIFVSYKIKKRGFDLSFYGVDGGTCLDLFALNVSSDFASKNFILFAKLLRTLLTGRWTLKKLRFGVLRPLITNKKEPQKDSFLLSMAGLEPARISPHAPQTCAYTDSATSTHLCYSIFND